MRILIDGRPLQERRPAGVSIYATEMTRELVASGAHRYSVFGNASSGIPFQVPGADVRFSRYPNKLLNAAFVATGRPRMERLAGDADALWLPNLNFAPTSLPTVVTVHDLSFMRYPRFFGPRQRLWHAAVRPRELLARAAAIVAVSRHSKSDIMDAFGIAGERIHVISPGISPAFSPSAADDAPRVRQAYGLPERYVLSLATLEPRKNFPGLIAGFSRLDTDAALVIAGASGWLYRDIFRAAASSPAADRIRFVGYVHEKDKPGLYAGAAAFVYPSFYEGFGMPAAEAMACGTPVVASNSSSLAEVVGDAGILVNPSNATEIAEGIDAALTMPRMFFSSGGIARAKKFSWPEAAEALELVFNAVVPSLSSTH